MLIVSLLIALFFLGSFFWATRNNQFDDDYTPSVRMLFDEELIDTENQKKETNGSTDSRATEI